MKGKYTAPPRSFPSSPFHRAIYTSNVSSRFNFGSIIFQLKNESRTITAEPQAFGTNCADLYASGVREDGVYSIDPDGLGSFQVRCEMSSGSGWTVIQRRLDGSVNFYLGWSQYKSGFGDLNGEFWLGLDKIHRLTKSGLNVLRVDLMDFNNAHAYAQYTTFKISDESSRYTLNVGGFSGELLEFFF